jgi:hypothetical protein
MTMQQAERTQRGALLADLAAWLEKIHGLTAVLMDGSDPVLRVRSRYRNTMVVVICFHGVWQFVWGKTGTGSVTHMQETAGRLAQYLRRPTT